MSLVYLFMALIGVILAVVFALADVIGIGRDPAVFGLLQWAGMIVGAILVVAGFVLYRRFAPQPPSPLPGIGTFAAKEQMTARPAGSDLPRGREEEPGKPPSGGGSGGEGGGGSGRKPVIGDGIGVEEPPEPWRPEPWSGGDSFPSGPGGISGGDVGGDFGGDPDTRGF